MVEEFSTEFSEFFKFNSSHFVLYEGFREPLHGHNYKVSLSITSSILNEEGNILKQEIIESIMNAICKSLKHRLLLPSLNKCINIKEEGDNFVLLCEDKSVFSIPKSDCRVLAIQQISAECLAKYITLEFFNSLRSNHADSLSQVKLKSINIKVSEDRGKKGVYNLKFN